MGLIKWVIRSIVLLVVVAGLLVGSLFLIPQEHLGRIASEQLSTLLGRDVSLGNVGISVFPNPSLSVTDMRVANADWAGDEPMLTASSASLKLDLNALLAREITVRGISATQPKINLIRRADGRANWEFGETGSTSASSGGSGSLPALDLLTITDGTVRFTDAGSLTKIDDVNVQVRWPDTNGPLTAKGSVNPMGAPLNFNATLHNVIQFANGKPITTDLRIDVAGGNIAYIGEVTPNVAGKVTLDLSNTAKAAQSFGVAGLDLPKGLGRSLKGQANVTFKGNRLTLRKANLTMDQNQFTADADVVLDQKPVINATISAPNLDLSGLDTGETAEAPSSDGWSTAPIDMSFLSAFDGEIRFDTDALQVAGLSFGRTDTVMTNDNARAVFEIRQLSGYEGVMKGSLVANNRNGFSTRATLSFKSLELEQLLKDFMDVDSFSGKANGDINLLGSGQSMQAIMSSLSGEGALLAGPGVIRGIDLAAALTGRADGGTTVFQTAKASFTVNNGILKNNDLRMELGQLEAQGDGRVNLGKRSMDYLMTVLAPKARGGQGLAIPVRVSGAWSKLKIHVDAADVIKKNFAEEKKKIEKEVQTKVNQAVGKELGLDVQEGQTVEDAAKDKLEQEKRKLEQELEKKVGEGLLNLLGGN